MTDRQTQFGGSPLSVVRFVENGTHKTISPQDGFRASGMMRVSDRDTVDALREAFELAGWEVVDLVG